MSTFTKIQSLVDADTNVKSFHFSDSPCCEGATCSPGADFFFKLFILVASLPRCHVPGVATKLRWLHWDRTELSGSVSCHWCYHLTKLKWFLNAHASICAHRYGHVCSIITDLRTGEAESRAAWHARLCEASYSKSSGKDPRIIHNTPSPKHKNHCSPSGWQVPVFRLQQVLFQLDVTTPAKMTDNDRCSCW